MGVLPLEFLPGETRETLGLTGHEIFEIEGVASLTARKNITVSAKGEHGAKQFTVVARIDTPDEVSYYQHGGILQYVLRQMLN
jgi:aconitate hydratase